MKKYVEYYVRCALYFDHGQIKQRRTRRVKRVTRFTQGLATHNKKRTQRPNEVKVSEADNERNQVADNEFQNERLIVDTLPPKCSRINVLKRILGGFKKHLFLLWRIKL